MALVFDQVLYCGISGFKWRLRGSGGVVEALLLCRAFTGYSVSNYLISVFSAGFVLSVFNAGLAYGSGCDMSG